MRVVVQRVRSARVEVEGASVGAIGPGLLVFLGVGRDDTEDDLEWLVGRLTRLRIFESSPGRMDQSLVQVDGEALVVSQFTLYGSLKKGNRPSFNRSADPEQAEALYRSFVERLEVALGKAVPTGRFGANMQIEAQNDGPVTLVIDSRDREF